MLKEPLKNGETVPHIAYTNYRTFDVDDLPADPEALKQWMYNLYYEKEDLLADFYANG